MPSGRMLFLLLLLTTTASAGAATAQDKLLAIEAVKFQAGVDTGVFIAGTTSDLAREVGAVPVSFMVYGPDAPDSVSIVQIKLQYPTSALDYLGWSRDPYWQGDIVVSNDGAGTITVECDADTRPAPTLDFATVVTLKFSPLCQPELTANPITVMPESSNSFLVQDNTRYAAAAEMCFPGAVEVADYAGYVSIINPDPAAPADLVLEGAADNGYEFVVPFYLASNANVAWIQGAVTYDPARLLPIAFDLPPDCGNWYFSGSGVPEPVDGGFSFSLTNYPPAPTDGGTPCPIMNVTFRVLGDWRGQSTAIDFDPLFANALAIGNEIIATCPDAGVSHAFDGGVVACAQYVGTVTTRTDMIYAADAGTTKSVTAVVSLTNNFPAGCPDASPTAETAPLRLALDLPEGVLIQDLYQPDLLSPDPDDPLDDFWFHYHVGTAKTVVQNLEFYSEPKAGLANLRTITPEAEPLLRFHLLLPEVPAPLGFADNPFPLAYACSFEGRAARVLDESTCALQADCTQETLIFGDTPAIKYAIGELTCSTRTSTRPANVVQDYYARSTFPLADFIVTVRKSGSHRIVGFVPGQDVVVVASGSDFVTFGPGPGWSPAVHETAFKLGTITYNLSTSTPVFDKAAGATEADKDIAPPVTWCWAWTDITFDPASYLADGSGNDPFMFKVEGDVGTRWDCSAVYLPAAKDGRGDLPDRFALTGNFPNPFNPSTTIAFALPRDATVTIDIVDLQGRRVTTLVDEFRKAGRYDVVWLGRDSAGRAAASGVYFAVMRAAGVVDLQKMILLK